MKFLLIFLVSLFLVTEGMKQKKKMSLSEIADQKEFKKLLRTKNNVLVAFLGKERPASLDSLLATLAELSETVRGKGTVTSVNCESTSETKKLCKKLKINNPNGHILKHFKDGGFHMDYDRSEKLSSLVNFMQDPTGDQPWEEVESAQDIIHIQHKDQFKKFLKTEKGKVLVMFYAPWCGFCKRMKPDYEKAASDVKKFATLLAVDSTKEGNRDLSRKYNVTGFPTLVFFQNGKTQYPYPGDNNHKAIVEFLDNPNEEVPVKEKDGAWKDDLDTKVNHLTDKTFDDFLKSNENVLVMFYAPWCGHCKRMKPELEAAAEEMSKESSSITGKLAAVDCTTENELAKRYEVKGYPTIKFFKAGEFAFDAGHTREKKEIVKFLRDPKEPPPPPPAEKPWSEEEDSHVIHLTKENYKAVLKKKKHALVMFYAPWCGHCKRAKPEISHAAEEMKDNVKVTFAAVDCTEEKEICSEHEVSGFPTFKYFRYLDREPVRIYDGGRTASNFVAFMSDPDNELSPPPPPLPQETWAGLKGTVNVKHLSDKDFDKTLKESFNVLVVFYAPWCGHCQAMKKDYALAAEAMNYDSKVLFAAVDATSEQELSKKYNVRGYPTIKFFKNGKYSQDYQQGRTKVDFINFLRAESQRKDEL